MALVAYRTLLRSSRIAFQGDIKTLTAARRAARDGFERGRHLPLGSEEASKQIHHAQDVAKILRENVLQGAAIDGDNKFKLRIHEHTELGDNNSIKKASMGGKIAENCSCS